MGRGGAEASKAQEALPIAGSKPRLGWRRGPAKAERALIGRHGGGGREGAESGYHALGGGALFGEERRFTWVERSRTTRNNFRKATAGRARHYRVSRTIIARWRRRPQSKRTAFTIHPLRPIHPALACATAAAMPTVGHPAILLVWSQASALSWIAGNRRRSSTAAENSPARSKAERIAAASSSVATNIAKTRSRPMRRRATATSRECGRKSDRALEFIAAEDIFWTAT